MDKLRLPMSPLRIRRWAPTVANGDRQPIAESGRRQNLIIHDKKLSLFLLRSNTLLHLFYGMKQVAARTQHISPGMLSLGMSLHFSVCSDRSFKHTVFGGDELAATT